MQVAVPVPFRSRPAITGWRGAVDSRRGRLAALLGTGALAGR